MEMKNKEKYLITTICVICLCLWGGIYDFTVAIYGVIFSICILAIILQKKQVDIPINVTGIGLMIIFLCSLVSIFVARDHGIAFIGTLRVLVFLAFWIMWCNIDELKKHTIWDILPEMSAIITLLSIVLYFIPQAREYLYSANRLGGVMQYSNTYAMLLLIAFIVLVYREEKKKTAYATGITLIAGILFCGSRSVFMLLIIVLLMLLIKRKIPSKYLFIGVIAIAGFVIVLQLLMKLDIQRLLKITVNSSTLNGRILYWYDGIIQLLKNPFGLGYMGYFFKQPQFQTGNYTTKYVHNDFLQMGLDYGIIAAVAFLFIVLYAIFSKKVNERNRLILIFLAIHALFDFDLQYGFMFCMLLMTMKTEADKAWHFRGISGHCIIIAGLIVSGYFAVALGLEYIGKTEAALILYPVNSFALQDELDVAVDDKVSGRLIECNGMVAAAYENAAGFSVDDWNYKDAVTQIDSMLEYAGYDSYYYNQAVFYYSKCLDEAVRSEDMEATQDILNKITELPDVISEKESNASKFAYRINDKPQIDLQEDIQNYIDNMSQIEITN